MSIKRFVPILAILCVLGAALAVPTTVARAQTNTQTQSASNVTCWGDWCSGQDPHATHCDADAVTLASVTATAGNTQLSDDTNRKGTLEVRYSPTCKTKWSRLSLPKFPPK
jgi:type VI protein secretion system component VasA